MSGNGKHKRALYILENSKPIKLLMFQKMELSSPSSKKQKNLPPPPPPPPPQKKKKKKILMFQEVELCYPTKTFLKN